MKLLLCLLFFAKTVFSQKIDGFGIFQIGSNRSTIVKQLGRNVITINDDKEKDSLLKRNPNVISRFPRNPESSAIYKIEKAKQSSVSLSFGKTSFTAGFHKNCDLYFIKEYLYQDILIKNIFLVFQNDKLTMIEPDGSSEIYLKLSSIKKSDTTITSADSIVCKGLNSIIAPKMNSVAFVAKWKDSIAEATYITRPAFDINCNSIRIYRMIFIDNLFFDYLAKFPIMDMKKTYSR